MTPEGIAAITFPVEIVTEWRLSERNVKKVVDCVAEVIRKLRLVKESIEQISLECRKLIRIYFGFALLHSVIGF